MSARLPLAERFKAPQGEGLYTGTQMAFMRTVGCSVGQKVCTACDTDFDRMQPHLGGGVYDVADLVQWARTPEQDGGRGCEHIVITGGEPMDRDLRPLLQQAGDMLCHVETSGTQHPEWLDPKVQPREQGLSATHAVKFSTHWSWHRMWVTVSPKPGYDRFMTDYVADEIKVIIGGLGDGPGWPTVDDALRWADMGKLVYVQPRNLTKHVDGAALAAVLQLVDKHPQLRLSCQLHKFLGVR